MYIWYTHEHSILDEEFVILPDLQIDKKIMCREKYIHSQTKSLPESESPRHKKVGPQDGYAPHCLVHDLESLRHRHLVEDDARVDGELPAALELEIGPAAPELELPVLP